MILDSADSDEADLEDGDPRKGVAPGAPDFRQWLIVSALEQARAIVPKGRDRWPHDHPIEEAIRDLRAAAIFDDGRDEQDGWDIVNGMAGFSTHPADRLRRWGIQMPRHIFDAVWALYCAFVHLSFREPQDLSAAANDQSISGHMAAELRLTRALVETYERGAIETCRRRYGTDPIPP